MSAASLLCRRADRLLSMTIGLPDTFSDGGEMSPVRGELKMVRGALHIACQDLFGRSSAEHQSSARRFLETVAPSLIEDARVIVDAEKRGLDL